MPTKFYDHTTFPAQGQAGSSSSMRAELSSIEAGFDLVDLTKADKSELASKADVSALDNKADNADLATLYSQTQSDYQPKSAILSAYGALSYTANKVVYTIGVNSFALMTVTALGRSLLEHEDPTSFRIQINSAKSGDNQDIEHLNSIKSIGSGPIGGGRNFVVNGGCRISQRPAAPLSPAEQFGAVDRMIFSCSGASVSGSIVQVENDAFESKFAAGISGAGWSSGLLVFKTKIEAAETKRLNGKTVTVSAKIYHNYGSTTNFTIGLIKPSAKDNYSSVSMIYSAGSTVSVPSGTVTEVACTFSSLGATGGSDPTNGLGILIQNTSNISVSGKTFLIGDICLEVGSVPTKFEVLDYSRDLERCRRFYQTNSNTIWGGDVTSGSSYYSQERFTTPMRISSPSVSVLNVGANGFPAANPTINVVTENGFSCYMTANANVNGGYFVYSWVADGEIP